MKKGIFVQFVTLAIGLSAANAATISYWDFQNPAVPAIQNDAAAYPNAIAPATGNGNAGGLHASAATDWSVPAGNGSTNSFSSNTWAVGDYYQFTLSTVGFTGIYLGYAQTGSATGPKDFKLQYSTAGVGGPFTDFNTYVVPTNAGAAIGWSTGTAQPASFMTFDLSGIPALNNNASVVFRIIDNSTVAINGSAVAAAGTGRIDDFTVADAPVVPEPASMGLIALTSVAMIALRRRRA